MAHSKTLYLKPAADRIVRDPVTLRPLDAEGEEKPDTIFWRRRLRFGEVVERSRPRSSKPGKPAAGKTEKDS